MKAVRSVKYVAVAVLAAALSGCSSNPFSADTITVTADFDNAAGLYVGNEVAILGMPVGKVESIEPNGDNVRVSFTVKEDVQVPADAMAVTLSTSVLTDRHIELTPPYREGPTLANNDHIGVDRTRTPIEIDRVLAMADKLGTELDGDRNGNGPIADILDVGSAVTAGNGDKIRTALSQLASALRMSSDGGAATRDQLTSIVENLDVLTPAAADNDATIREFGSNLRQLTDIVADEDLGSGTTGAQINEILQEAAVLLQNNREKIRATVGNSTKITTAISDFERNLAETLDLAPLTLSNVYRAIDPSNKAVRIHAATDKIILDSQLGKEICNLLNLQNLGCNTGKLSDYGPDFGVLSILIAMSELPR